MEEILKISLINDLKELDSIATKVEDLSQRWNLSDSDSYRINLILDELFTNIVSYGFNDSNQHNIDITITKKEKQIDFIVEDDGSAFNPLEYNPQNIDAEIEEREIGGLGILFLNKFMVNLLYERINNKNKLYFTKLITE